MWNEKKKQNINSVNVVWNDEIGGTKIVIISYLCLQCSIAHMFTHSFEQKWMTKKVERTINVIYILHSPTQFTNCGIYQFKYDQAWRKLTKFVWNENWMVFFFSHVKTKILISTCSFVPLTHEQYLVAQMPTDPFLHFFLPLSDSYFLSFLRIFLFVYVPNDLCIAHHPYPPTPSHV